MVIKSPVRERPNGQLLGCPRFTPMHDIAHRAIADPVLFGDGLGRTPTGMLLANQLGQLTTRQMLRAQSNSPRNMLPILPTDGVPGGSMTDTKGGSAFNGVGPASVHAAHVNDLLLGHDGRSGVLAARGTCAAFGFHVRKVFGLGAKEHVVRIAAGANVTAMTDVQSSFDRAVDRLPREAMSKFFPAWLGKVDLAVAVRVLAASPDPARPKVGSVKFLGDVSAKGCYNALVDHGYAPWLARRGRSDHRSRHPQYTICSHGRQH